MMDVEFWAKPFLGFILCNNNSLFPVPRFVSAGEPSQGLRGFTL
jgi:hypothetical protein